MTITTDEYWPCLECGSESAATCLQPEGCAASRERIIAISAELEEAQKELAEANGWLKHYRKAEPEQYAELRKRLERYDRRSESGESLCDWLDMADELKRLKLVVDGCICQGNWRLIIKESEPLFGKKFSSGDEDYKFIGVLHAEDDYYYVMMESNGLRYRFLSCVGAIADHGF